MLERERQLEAVAFFKGPYQVDQHRVQAIGLEAHAAMGG
jgi:hypothetical protein